MNDENRILFLYPSSVLSPKKTDEIFCEEAEYIRECGFLTANISLENIENGLRFNSLQPYVGYTVIYRGWMLSVEQYNLLTQVLLKVGLIPLTSIEEYLSTHYLPNWYPLLIDLTSETKVFELNDELSINVTSLGWEKYFIKDYVKSLKTSIGSVINSAEEISTVVKEMKKYRGTVEGGICVRRFECYKKDSERRFFVVNNQPFSSRIDDKIPEIVYECAKRIKSHFFSVDIAERDDNQLRVIEVGDGQVSDLVGWSANRFSEIWL